MCASDVGLADVSTLSTVRERPCLATLASGVTPQDCSRPEAEAVLENFE
jgi:hypothetical protein